MGVNGVDPLGLAMGFLDWAKVICCDIPCGLVQGAGTGVKNVGLGVAEVGGIAVDTVTTVTSAATGWNCSTELSDFYSPGGAIAKTANFEQACRESGSSATGAYLLAGTKAASDFIGVTDYHDAVVGTSLTYDAQGNISGLDSLSVMERMGKAYQGTVKLDGVALMAAGGLKIRDNNLAAETASVTKARVMANIAENQKALKASNFDIYLARTSQIGKPYGGIDNWVHVNLNKGQLVYGGTPGQSAFYTDFATIEASGLNQVKLWEFLQVARCPKKGYRNNIQSYIVKEAITVPAGKVLANPQLGVGEGYQYYINNFKNMLEPATPYYLMKGN